MPPILKVHLETGNFNPGYLLIGNSEDFSPLARKAASIILSCDEFSLDSHPDFFGRSFESFNKEDGRDLIQKIATKPILAEKKVFSLFFSSMAPEAAFAFSKILEEPPLSCHFFFLTNSAENLPKVFRSRLLNVFQNGSYKLSEESKIFWQKFLKSGPMERLNFSKNAVSDRRAALDFLNELEIILTERLKNENKASPAFNKIISSLEELKSTRQFFFDRSASYKMIIEHFSLTIPKF